MTIACLYITVETQQWQLLIENENLNNNGWHYNQRQQHKQHFCFRNLKLYNTKNNDKWTLTTKDLDLIWRGTTALSFCIFSFENRSMVVLTLCVYTVLTDPSITNISFLWLNENYGETCLNKISLRPIFVSGIDRCSVYTGWIKKEFLHGNFLFSLYRILVYSEFRQDSGLFRV